MAESSGDSGGTDRACPDPVPGAVIVLLGARASGKSTIGRKLASRLERPLVDLDDLVKARFGGAGVSDIWKSQGEAAFRAAECDALLEVLGAGAEDDASDHRPATQRRRPRPVLALGGGTPTIERARQALQNGRERGQVRMVYLAATARVLSDRLRAAEQTGRNDRPSLTGLPLEQEVAAILEARAPLYRELADIEVQTDLGTVDDVVLEVLRRLGR